MAAPMALGDDGHRITCRLITISLDMMVGADSSCRLRTVIVDLELELGVASSCRLRATAFVV